MKPELEEFRRQNEILLEAVKFYANKENYNSEDICRPTGNKVYDVCLFDFDRDFEPGKDFAGKRAREALKEFREKNK